MKVLKVADGELEVYPDAAGLTLIHRPTGNVTRLTVPETADMIRDLLSQLRCMGYEDQESYQTLKANFHRFEEYAATVKRPS